MRFMNNSRLADVFEIGGNERMRALEGMRAIAVFFVFCQHYCMQFIIYGNLSGVTLQVARFWRTMGNCGVELFFVLSGFLIYGILLRRSPPFFNFMSRRLRRLYPAFLISVILGALLDHWRSLPKIPADFGGGVIYISENLFFLPGLLPIDPISAPNWSLSYEWWFYALATLLFSVFGLAKLRTATRLAVIVGLAALLLSSSACGVSYVPLRGLSLLAGMLLAEANAAKIRPVPGGLAVAAVLLTFVAYYAWVEAAWVGALLLAVGFWTICSAAIGNRSVVSVWLSWTPLRYFGNMSYSYYLVHAFVVVPAARMLISKGTSDDIDLLFWSALLPVFVLSCVLGAALYLSIEKPLSLSQRAGAVTVAGLERPDSPASQGRGGARTA